MNEHPPTPHTSDTESPAGATILDAATTAFRQSLGTAPHSVTEMASITFRDATRTSSMGASRIILVLTALAGFAFDLPVLLGSAQHTTQDVAVLHVAMSIGFLLAAWRPGRYARGLAPVALTAAVMLALPFQASAGATAPGGVTELAHMPLLIGAATLAFSGWLTAPRHALH